MKKMLIRKDSVRCRGVSPLIFVTYFSLLMILVCCLMFSTAFAQEAEPIETEVTETAEIIETGTSIPDEPSEPEETAIADADRIAIDGSSLAAGQPFKFTVTVNSDEMRSFADVQTQLTAVLCPVGAGTESCQTLTQTTEGEDDIVMRIVFSAEALPAAGDYTLDVNFFDASGEFASQTASYLLTGVRSADELLIGANITPIVTETAEAAASETPETTGTVTVTPEASATVTPEVTETAEPVIDIPMSVKPITLVPEFLDADGNVLVYGASLYVNEPYTLQIRSDSALNDSVSVSVELPASLQAAPLDPESECFQYINEAGSALLFPGSLWNEENGGAFRCELRYTDRAWLTADPIVVSVDPSGKPAEETYEMVPVRWSNYPATVTQHAATHQAQITDSRGNLLCSDTVHCGMFSSDEVYILTYKFPSDWGGNAAPGRQFTVDFSWPDPWAAALRNPSNLEIAAAYGTPCEVDETGMTHFELTEISEGRYQASCVFTPGAIRDAVTSSINVHFNDNAWAVQDLSLGLSPVIIKEQPTEQVTPTAEITETAQPAEVTETVTATEDSGIVNETQEPVFDIQMTVKPVTLTPSITDENGNALIYGSTLYVGEPYFFNLRSDSAMNDSVMIQASLPVSLQTAPLDPSCECMQYLNADGIALQIPGSAFRIETGNAFRCELRYSDKTWLAAEPVTFTVASTGFTADETYEMAPLSWNYYPVNITQFAATHQVQITDSRGNLLCSDTVPCGMFNADDVYILTYKFPADWSAAMPSGRVFTTDVTWPADWAAALGQGTDADMAAMFGTVCTVDSDGTTHFDLQEVSEGRYAASCAFVPSGIANPVQAAAIVHLNDNSWAVNDLNVYMPSVIVKRQAAISPSLTLRMTEDAAEQEQIYGNTLSTLYRTTSNYPNSSDGFGKPALYTLKARVEGVSSSRSPQNGDYVQVNWSVLDVLAQSGDLPSCLVPTEAGYMLGTLEQKEDGAWESECSFRFPMSISDDTAAGTMSMELMSGVYNTSAQVAMSGTPFHREAITVNLSVPQNMLLNQTTEFRASLSDSTGGFSDYTRAVLNDAGVSLYSTWDYNYLTTCQGDYLIDENGTASCSAYFNQTTDIETTIHYDLISPALESLFAVNYAPAQDFVIRPITTPRANLSVKLFHMGEEMPLPADADDSFIVGDDYQLQFYLTPDEEYRSVVNAVSVDSEGLVIDWWQPLLIRWGMLPNGETSLNFYRDGDSFIARYDFNFGTGDLQLDGSLSQLVMECVIQGWDIYGDNYMVPLQLPSRVEKKEVSLTISDFKVDSSEETKADVYVNETARFDVTFSGALDYFDSTQLLVGYEAAGVRTPVECFPDYSAGVLSCSFTAQCTDYNNGEYTSVCGDDIILYAEYNGDDYNRATSAEPKVFDIKRGEIRFSPEAEGSLSKLDLQKLEAADGDFLNYEEVSVKVNGWGVDTYLPREVRDQNGSEYKSYPIVFHYEKSGEDTLEEEKLYLEVAYQRGNGELPVSETISIKPQLVTDDMVSFALDFGSYEMLDDGRTVREALDEAVTITSLTLRYAGSEFYAPSSAPFTAEDVTFAIKIVTLLDLETDLSMPGILHFGGSAGAEMLLEPFTVYCSQLYEPINCYKEFSGIYTEESDTFDLSSQSAPGCWGVVNTTPGYNDIYVDGNIYDPQCYLLTWSDDNQIILGADL